VRVHAVDTTSKLYRLDYESWLIIEKSEDGIRFFIANFPKTKSWKSLVKMTHLRWKIEQGYQRMKEELGLDHFEGRSWLGLHHHIMLCFMAYCFLLWIQSRFKKKIQDLTFPAVRHWLNLIFSHITCPHCRKEHNGTNKTFFNELTFT